MSGSDAGALNEPARRRRQIALGLAAVVLLGLIAAIVFRDRDDTGPYLYRADVGPLHVHAIVASPDGRRLLAATHFGLYGGVIGGPEPRRIGSGRDDLTAIAQLPGGAGLIASGHANPLRDGPKMLGALTSADGRAWRTRSLRGRVGFSILRSSRDTIYGYDPVTERLFVSRDGGQTWPERRRAPRDAFDLAVDPADPRALALTNFRGVHRSNDGGRSWRAQSVLTGLLVWPRGGDLTLVARRAVYSHNGGAWSRIGTAPEHRPVALAAGPRGAIYATSHRGEWIYESTDGGAGWEQAGD